jgi:ferredoxin
MPRRDGNARRRRAARGTKESHGQGFGRCWRRGRQREMPGARPELPTPVFFPAPSGVTNQEELNRLRAQAAAIEGELAQLRTGPTESQALRPQMAMVDRRKCTLCGVCADVCPTGAITLDDAVAVDLRKCTGCGVCVEHCPQQAIVLT